MSRKNLKIEPYQTSPDFKAFDKAAREEMLVSAEMVLEAQRVLANAKQNVVGELLRFTDKFMEWNHVPPKDILDPISYSQYYYHAHPKSKSGTEIHDDEHGHFHVFMRGKGIPDNIKPFPADDLDPQKDKKDMTCHLIGIGMNAKGIPIKLFTTNRWVTGETWYKSDDVIALLDSYEVDHAWPSWPANLWVTNMLKLFQPQITELIKERDLAIQNWKQQHPESHVFEDRGLEVTSWCPIDIDQQITDLQESL